MNQLFSFSCKPSVQQLKARIFNVIPAASFQMDRLLQLLDIDESDDIDTACVECKAQPRLLLNPRFVAQHCQKDEHLFLLILHELYHVILGHTRLFKRVTEIDNIVFDAVINSLLSHQFPEQRYLDFFQSLNDWESFPARLLRPPPGWPHSPAPLPSDASASERKAIKLLYGENSKAATYHDLFEALLKGITVSKLHGFVLLGDHGNANEDGFILDPTLKDVVRRVVEAWPPPKKPISGRDDGHSPADFFLEPSKKPNDAFLQSLKKLLRRAGIFNSGTDGSRRRKNREIKHTFQTIIPQLRDRRNAAYDRLFKQRPFIYEATSIHRALVLEPGDVAHVYLDISGSMAKALPLLSRALAKPHRDGEVRLFVFSTVVDEVKPRIPIEKQKLQNTHGTDINCVLEHLAKGRKQIPKRVVLLTDGYTGQPQSDLAQKLRDQHVSFYVGLVGDNTSEELKPFARHFQSLPTL